MPIYIDIIIMIHKGGMRISSCIPTYSNCNAPTRLMNPSTTSAISQGRNLSRAVRLAPPFASPLCCGNRLIGFGVEPI